MLLDGGCTAHSALKWPLNWLSARRLLSVTFGRAKVLQQFSLIVWDECTMANKQVFKALDFTLQDLGSGIGGITVLLAGDYHHTLPVIVQGTIADEMNACLKMSYLWRVKTLKADHEHDSWVQLSGGPLAGLCSKQLITWGNGKAPDDAQTGLNAFPESFCTLVIITQQELEAAVFPNNQRNYRKHDWLQERVILDTPHETMKNINLQIQGMFLPLHQHFSRIQTKSSTT
ncbi:uncharacterized protein [Macrobrachium rosenbergii]|uniref:uncharacterized protein isoform X1 n=1 Tax=Macrobrachium rosenbergii TaxID=79674 RepID=UPI0034D79686